MLADLKIAFRGLARSPGFTALAVLTLALAVGTNTAIFSIADAVLLRPLPYRDQGDVQILQMLDRRTSKRFLLIPYEYLQVIEQKGHGLEGVGMCESGPPLVVTTKDDARNVSVLTVTPNYFQLLGVNPAYGRLFDSADRLQLGRQAILTYQAWQEWFGGDERIIGRSASLGSATYDIIGILPSGFIFPSPLVGRPEIITAMPAKAAGAEGGSLYPIVRLRAGVTHKQAQLELQTLIAPLAAKTPKTANQTIVVDDVRSVLYPTGRSLMAFLLAASIFVLLIGCANLTTMLLARHIKREREFGMRLALGASRTMLVRPLVLEASLIGFAAAILALFMTYILFDTIYRQIPASVYGNTFVGINSRVVLFTLGLGITAGILFSVVPAWQASRIDAQALIQRQLYLTGWRRRFGNPMITIQVALAIVLAFGAFVSGRAFLSVIRIPLGFNPQNIVTLKIRPDGLSGIDLQAFYLRAIEALRHHNDVISVGAVSSLPLSGSAPFEGAIIPGNSEIKAGIFHVLPGYFEAMQITLARGRLLNWNDIHGGASASIISESAARALFPDRDPLNLAFSSNRGKQFIVVGVVADTKGSLERDTSPPVYVIPSEATRSLVLTVRMKHRQGTTIPEIRREVNTLAPNTVITADWWIDNLNSLSSYSTPRFQALVLSIFACLALGLTALGVFGVVAFWVTTRSKEMGIRLSFGASPSSLIALIVKQVMAPILLGLFFGSAAIYGLSRLAEATLFQIHTYDPVAFVVTTGFVVTTTLLAALIPARRVSSIDPVAVLRVE